MRPGRCTARSPAARSHASIRLPTPHARRRHDADFGPHHRARGGARQAPADVVFSATWCCVRTCACTARGTSIVRASDGSARATTCASPSRLTPFTPLASACRSRSSRPRLPCSGHQLRDIGCDPLSEGFDPAEAARRILGRPDMEIADALLDQTALAGIGNVYKSEMLFAARINPFTPVADVPGEVVTLVATAAKFMRVNAQEAAGGGIVTYSGLRSTTGRADPSARLWVYGRAGKPCRRCGTAISRRKHGPHARSTYWCGRCQEGDGHT